MSSSVQILDWRDGDPDTWTYKSLTKQTDLFVFELARVPNFAEPRFSDLGSSLEDRRTEVARRQLQMLRQLHALGTNSAFALRLVKDNDRIHLYILVRVNSTGDTSTEQFAKQIFGAFPKEYNLQRITKQQSADAWHTATDLSFVNRIDVLLKPEERHKANTWPYFYVSSLWQGQAANDLETLCRAIVRFDGNVAVDITAIPTKWESNERAWVEQSVKVMRQALNGERILSREDGRTLQTYEPLPGLRVPVDNNDDLIKRYDQNRIFLYSFRVLASNDPSGITHAFVSGAARSQPQIIQLTKEADKFQNELRAAQMIDISPQTRSVWWDTTEPLPFRAQRLHRLVDLDELASFWRLPIPVRAGFPGVELDIGDQRVSSSRKVTTATLSLGVFTDDIAKTGVSSEFNMQGLAKHGLVVGVPGSGKTTTMFNLLHQLWATEDTDEQIPFIVLEPAKTEYRALKTIPSFADEMLVFTLGDERTSPFRFNPFEVPNGIPVESHISRLNACFAGAFNLFDPLPLLLDRAIRQTYEVNGWYDDSIGGEPGLIVPTLSDLCQQAEAVIHSSGYSDKLRDDFNAALLQRLESLRRGSKGRMLDTRKSISFDMLMSRPVILELDALNEDEKALMMMFVLTFVYEYAKANRRSGSPLCHILVVEEAHNLIGRGDSGGGDFRANPKELAIRLFTRMLAEMRALGQGILIADQLPTAIAPEAVKQTNLKILMRMTARDDREEIGNTMDLDEAALKAVTRFKSGQALVYLEEWDRVRQIQTPNFKGQHGVEEPPDDESFAHTMSVFENQQPDIFMPFPQCPIGCERCNRRVRSQAERLVRPMIEKGAGNIAYSVRDDSSLYSTLCRTFKAKVAREVLQLKERYGQADSVLPFCAYLHLVNWVPETVQTCNEEQSDCECKLHAGHQVWIDKMLELGLKIQNV